MAPTTEVAAVRGRAKKQASMLAFIDPETLIPADHPLRTIKRFADETLLQLSALFDEMYAADGQGRVSIPPERLLKASLLISLYSIRSELAGAEHRRRNWSSPGAYPATSRPTVVARPAQE